MDDVDNDIMTPAEREAERRALRRLGVTLTSGGVMHSNAAAEQDGNDADGEQGGQVWSPPTAAPTTSAPTGSPTPYPTIAAFTRQLRGIMWYDRNGNGVRESNVYGPGFGSDVEYSHAVGGIQVQLVECDRETGMEIVDGAHAQTVTVGQDILGRAQIVKQDGENGKYRLVIPRERRHYYVKVTAPSGFLLTAGLCDDSADPAPGWGCDYEDIVSNILVPDARRSARRRLQAATGVASSPGGVPIGIGSGRSSTCVYVDGNGDVEDTLDFGVMREGDTQEVNSNVALVLEFDEAGSATVPGRRSLAEVLRRARVETLEDGTRRYLLADQDKAAIGTVTAEVLAGTLDARLAESGVELDAVNPKDVQMSNQKGNSQIAVAMEIKGHYSPPPDLDFDYIVQDSINRDTATIRRGLRDYNSNCRSQTTKMKDEGLTQTDFSAVVSNSGSSRGDRGGRVPTPDVSEFGEVFSTACSSDLLVPDYFETSLKEITARKVSEVNFDGMEMTYVAEESRGLDAWAMGPVAGIAGLIVLLVGALVFRRALGPRRVDKYAEVNKTRDVDAAENRRFGEAGGAMDDGSVDSAFYSESDDELEETEKERKMRRKKKEKADQQKSSRDVQKALRASTNSMQSKSSKSGRKKGGKSGKSRDGVKKKLSASMGSDDTHSLGDLDNSDDKIERARERKRRAKERADGKGRRSSTSSASDGDMARSSRRGRDRRSGGDNLRKSSMV